MYYTLQRLKLNYKNCSMVYLFGLGAEFWKNYAWQSISFKKWETLRILNVYATLLFWGQFVAMVWSWHVHCTQKTVNFIWGMVWKEHKKAFFFSLALYICVLLMFFDFVMCWLKLHRHYLAKSLMVRQVYAPTLNFNTVYN